MHWSRDHVMQRGLDALFISTGRNFRSVFMLGGQLYVWLSCWREDVLLLCEPEIRCNSRSVTSGASDSRSQVKCCSYMLKESETKASVSTSRFTRCCTFLLHEIMNEDLSRIIWSFLKQMQYRVPPFCFSCSVSFNKSSTLLRTASILPRNPRLPTRDFFYSCSPFNWVLVPHTFGPRRPTHVHSVFFWSSCVFPAMVA